MADFPSIEQALTTLWDDVDTSAEFYVQRPHLAHYTSITTAESIFKHKQLWFSNPLFMNDHQEMMWGIELPRPRPPCRKTPTKWLIS